jgi:hypothetical protein
MWEMAMIYVAYLLACLVVALLGMNRKLGFWGYFFASLLLSPLVGIILVLASDVRKNPA